jgi:predicted cytidylate kinase
MIITISGPPGSGKTTVATILSQRHDLHLITTGQMFRAMAREKGMGLDEFSAYAAQHHQVDNELDRRVMEEAKRLLAQGRGVVLEGRLAGHMAEAEGLRAFRVFLNAPLAVRTRRIQGSGRGEEKVSREDIARRERLEEERYRAIYGLDITDLGVYDLTIDSSDKTPEAIADEIADRAGLA